MFIRQLIWPEDRVEHIAGHDVRPEEVEEVCFGHPREEIEAIKQIAESKGIEEVSLVREWVLEKLHQS
jgi:hypothetical protein